MRNRNRALFRALPKLVLPWMDLGDFPTPVERLELRHRGDLYVKRDDLSSPFYGGNKVRTLEVLFGDALRQGKSRIVATGARGSNHALATALHAPRVGLQPHAILFPQPESSFARENERAIRAHMTVTDIPHWSMLPLAMWKERRADTFIMPPGGAIPLGALGYISAALELAEQIREGVLPEPSEIVVGVGSTCTSAGLLAGLTLAKRLGNLQRIPTVVAVRVTPWPVTSKRRVVDLAARSLSELTTLAEIECRSPISALSENLVVDGRQLGRGYGHRTRLGEAARLVLRHSGIERDVVPPMLLDHVYAAKAAAAFLDRGRAVTRGGRTGPILFWSTKSSAPLPSP